LKSKTWNDESVFDAAKNKAQFRQYEDACDRVKGFYKEQHGMGRDNV
jgi:inositol oxygenase